MILEKILFGIKYEIINNKNLDCEIKNLTIDSRQVVIGSMFFCIKGLNVDGHNFIDEAIKHGARAIMIENDLNNFDCDAVIIKVENVRKALAFCSANFFGYDEKNMNLIGVTGTNGKTSTTYLLKKILNEYKKNVGIIGTIDAKINDEHINIFYATSTTPDAIELQKILSYMREKKVDDVVMEVSSHALSLHKVDALKFKIGVFTNLTQDHLDFHGNMKNYLEAKKKLFDLCDIGVLNKDDEAWKEIKKNKKCKFVFYGINSDCDFKAENIICDSKFISFDLKIDGKKENFYVGIPGEFNIYNSLAAITTAYCLKIPVEIIKSALKKMTNVPGRMQRVESDKFNIIVDYAHSPDSLKNVLLAIKKFNEGRLILVFGCGGNRDKTKRKIMGEIASELADYFIITSDNPRMEDPMKIINDIETGIKKNLKFKYEKICDRREAIKRAIEIYNDGDIILIAGKGHENYQIFADRTVYFDDVEVAKEIINLLEKKIKYRELFWLKNIFLREVVKAVNGKFFGDENKLDEMICDVKIDSRKVCKGSLFIAIKGEKFDGHDFIDQAFLNGAVCVLSEKNLDIEKNFIKVESCKQALMDLAEYYRNLFDIKVIGITGSYGKTSVKDLTADILMEKYNVVRTMGNFNNNIGLPLSVFELNDETEILVLEMGTNHFGEINVLSKIVRPDICVINNIGVAHMENFLNRDGILKAKCEIFDYANKNFISILNGDDEYLRKIKLDEKRVFYCGFEKNNDIYVEKISDDKKNFKVNIMDCEINLDFANEMFVKNCVMAIGIGKYFGVKDKDIKKAIENFEFKNMRMELIDVKNKFYIINDVYNANPDAMKGAIDSLVLFDKKNIKKKICILGDMFELGDDAKEFHEEIGKYIDNKKIDLVICIGELAKNIFDGMNKIKKKYFRAKEDFFDEIDKFDFDESVILIKASRGMKFEEIVNKFVG